MKHNRFVLPCAKVASALAFALFTMTPEAQAADWIIKDNSVQDRPHELGILLSIPYCCGGFGLDPGILYGLPIVKKGFVPINDSFYIELGAWTHIPLERNDSFGVTPVGGVRWNFHLMEVWDAYAALRMGATIDNHPNFFINGAVGTTWKFSKVVGLRGELGGGSSGGDAVIGIDIDFR